MNESLSFSVSRIEARAREFISSIELSMEIAISEVSLHLLQCSQSQSLIRFPIGRTFVAQVTTLDLAYIRLMNGRAVATFVNRVR